MSFIAINFKKYRGAILQMKMTMKTFSSLIKQYKKPNELKFLTPLLVVINYLTMMSVIVVIC